MNINIEQTIKDRFAAPLADNYQRHIIFWKDPDGEFSDMVDELELDDVKVIKLTGSNNFAVKQLLSETDLTSNYLVYDPLSYDDIKDNWLLDIELYSEEFRADLLSIKMQELGIEPTPKIRKAMKAYTKFFENKERVAKLNAFGSDYSSVGQLHLDVLAVLSGTEDDTPAGVIRAVLSKGLYLENNEAIINIKKFGSEAAFWELVKQYTGYVYDGTISLMDLESLIIFTALSMTMKESCLVGFEKLISETHQNQCYSLVNEWLHSSEYDGLYNVARAVEEQYGISKRLEGFDVEDYVRSGCLPCIDECIVRHYMKDISEDVVKADEITATIEKRRTQRWYGRLKYYYEGLLQVANMQAFYQANVGGFHTADYKMLWKGYCEKYYQMDRYYRLFHLAFGKSLKESSTGLEDLYKGVADYVEKLYKNWYLTTLGQQWTKLVSDEMNKGFKLQGIPQQMDFYRDHVRPLESSGSRAFVIISDALRYEVASELESMLVRNTKGTAKLTSIQAIFPSVTKFGMAALLPHKDVQITDDVQVLCDGQSTTGTAERNKILNNYHEGNVAVSYKTLLGMKTAERREMIKNANVVYIYHNAIDAVGDKSVTEDQVFNACEQAISEITNLVKLIVNDMNGTNVFITADHGFIYSYKQLKETDKADKDFIHGNIIEPDKRYVIADGECTAEHMISIPMSHVNSSFTGFTPLDYIRIKRQGGGSNYVHGGISLQEIVVPVIEYKNVRAGSKKFVDITKAELQLLSTSRKVSNSIFSLDFYQTEPVSGKVTAGTYKVYMADISGSAVSDIQTVIADKTSPEGSERAIRVSFTLKSMEFNNTDMYYLMIVDKDTNEEIERIEFNIDVVFVNEFDF